MEIYLKHKLLVLRPLLITGEKYQKHLEKVTGWDYSQIPKGLIGALGIFSKDELWMVELSVPELFSANRRKIGEVLIRASNELDDNNKFESFCCARIPGCFAFLQEIISNDPIFVYVPNGVNDHVELINSAEL